MISTPLTEARLRGVAANPAAPSEVLLRLLAPQGRAAWAVLCGQRALPAEVVEAVLAHPDRAVRRHFARNRYAAPEERGRLARDPQAMVRAALAGGPRPLWPGAVAPLPDAALEALLTARDEDFPDGQLLTTAEVASELAGSGQIPPAFRRRMATHPDPELRRQAGPPWIWLTPEQRAALLADPDPAVADEARERSLVLDPAVMEARLPEEDCHFRHLVLVNYAISPAVAARCLAERRDLWSLAANPHTPAEVLPRLARDPDPRVRERVAARADLTPDLLADLSEDQDDAVRTRARLHPLPRTWPQCHAVGRLIGHDADCLGPVPEMYHEPETAWYEECAASPHPLLRRVAATCARLPEQWVHRLAQDQDPDVRHLLACNHPLAPPALVLEAFLALPRQRTYLLTHPRLPRTGLAHLLAHEAPVVRALAAADPTLPEPPLHLLADPDDHVRRTAAANPLLPLDLVDRLLDDPALAEGAAAHPRLPAGRLHQLLDEAGLPERMT
ncbi:hypothetical protein ACIRD3_34270 [Kitasatospora sp. NPDC093550]|uniref:hypothetical protein n=1 Tax=Kitasatospora sp. NPDC093550 TaxID=3364089 RepID=UPI0037FCB0EF